MLWNMRVPSLGCASASPRGIGAGPSPCRTLPQPTPKTFQIKQLQVTTVIPAFVC